MRSRISKVFMDGNLIQLKAAVYRILNVSETHSMSDFSVSDFEEETNSTKLVRKKSKGSNLEELYKSQAGKVLKATAHTITFLQKKSKEKVVLFKRDVAKDTKMSAGT